MFQWLGNLARAAGAGAARIYFNASYARYGQMTELKVDKAARRIEATFMLSGEKEAIRVVLEDYELATTEAGGTLTFKGVKVSRPWMEVAATEYLVGRLLPLPKLAVKAMRMVM